MPQDRSSQSQKETLIFGDIFGTSSKARKKHHDDMLHPHASDKAKATCLLHSFRPKHH